MVNPDTVNRVISNVTLCICLQGADDRGVMELQDGASTTSPDSTKPTRDSMSMRLTLAGYQSTEGERTKTINILKRMPLRHGKGKNWVHVQVSKTLAVQAVFPHNLNRIAKHNMDRSCNKNSLQLNWGTQAPNSPFSLIFLLCHPWNYITKF